VQELAAMRRALALAERGRRTVSPNPLVGCVLLRDGQVVGEGWHVRAGEPHAEAVALRAAGSLAHGATCCVTLEPCTHTGRTGPCTTALLQAGVARVVVALADPNPVAAGGAALLRAAGVDVEIGCLAEEAAEQNRVFLHGLATGRPHVVLKAAVSVDGRIAAADGTSRWITGPSARRRAHELRAEVDAVVVGSGTVLADDPRLTARLDDAPDVAQPLRVVLDGRGRVPASARALGERAWHVTGPRAHDLPGLLDELWAADVRSVLVEGGAAVAAAFVRAGLVDELHAHVAPLLLGEAGLPLLTGDGIDTLEVAPRFHTVAVERAGNDVLLELRPER